MGRDGRHAGPLPGRKGGADRNYRRRDRGGHRGRAHLARAARRDHDLGLDRLVRPIANFFQQRVRPRRIISVLLLRPTEIGVGLVVDAAQQRRFAANRLSSSS